MKRYCHYTKYDSQNRPVMTGIHTGGTYDEHTAALATASLFCEQRGTNIHGYTNLSYPVAASADEILSVTYYDDYDWRSGAANAFVADSVAGDGYSTNTLGLSTGSKIKVLDPGAGAVQWLTSAVYYDDDYRTIQTVADLWPGGPRNDTQGVEPHRRADRRVAHRRPGLRHGRADDDTRRCHDRAHHRPRHFS
jgi:hypothetical protein